MSISTCFYFMNSHWWPSNRPGKHVHIDCNTWQITPLTTYLVVYTGIRFEARSICLAIYIYIYVEQLKMYLPKSIPDGIFSSFHEKSLKKRLSFVPFIFSFFYFLLFFVFLFLSHIDDVNRRVLHRSRRDRAAAWSGGEYWGQGNII